MASPAEPKTTQMVREHKRRNPQVCTEGMVLLMVQ